MPDDAEAGIEFTFEQAADHEIRVGDSFHYDDRWYTVLAVEPTGPITFIKTWNQEAVPKTVVVRAVPKVEAAA